MNKLVDYNWVVDDLTKDSSKKIDTELDDALPATNYCFKRKVQGKAVSHMKDSLT